MTYILTPINGWPYQADLTYDEFKLAFKNAEHNGRALRSLELVDTNSNKPFNRVEFDRGQEANK